MNRQWHPIISKMSPGERDNKNALRSSLQMKTVSLNKLSRAMEDFFFLILTSQRVAKLITKLVGYVGVEHPDAMPTS